MNPLPVQMCITPILSGVSIIVIVTTVIIRNGPLRHAVLNFVDSSFAQVAELSVLKFSRIMKEIIVGEPESPGTPGSETVQMPFRCQRAFSARLVRAKGAILRVTGEKLSDNRFFLQLLEIGLKEIELKYQS